MKYDQLDQGAAEHETFRGVYGQNSTISGQRLIYSPLNGITKALTLKDVKTHNTVHCYIQLLIVKSPKPCN